MTLFRFAGHYGWLVTFCSACLPDAAQQPPIRADAAAVVADAASISAKNPGGADIPDKFAGAFSGLCDRAVAFEGPHQAWGPQARVDDFGAAGDGHTHDGAAVSAAIQAAGPGGTVLFTAGRTYVTCRPLSSLVGQTWTSTGPGLATLRRCDAVTAPLIEPAPAGAATFRIAQDHGFEAGMWISAVAPSGRDRSAGDVTHHPVASVTGGLVKFGNPLGRSFEVGDLVVTSFHMARMDRWSTVAGLRFDGNRAGNDLFLAWERHTSLVVAGDGVTIRDCEFIQAQGDSIAISGSRDTVVRNSLIEHGNGSAVHLSSAVRPHLLDNVVRHTNEQATVTGHAEAMITWSLYNQDVRVARNCFEHAQTPALGDLLVHGYNSGAEIEHNVFRDTTGILRVAGISGGSLRLGFRHNLADRAGDVRIDNSHATEPMDDVDIADNDIRNGRMFLKFMRRATVRNNRVSVDDPAYDTQQGSSGSHLGLITCWRGVSVAIEGNDLDGASRGLFIANLPGGVCDSVLIRGNTVRNQGSHALAIGIVDYFGSPGHIQGRLEGVTAIGNTLISNSATPQADLGWVGPGALFSYNCGEAAQNGLMVFGRPVSLGTPAARILHNTLRAGAESLVFNLGTLADLVVADNVLSRPLPAKLLAAANVKVERNTVASAAACDLAVRPGALF